MLNRKRVLPIILVIITLITSVITSGFTAHAETEPQVIPYKSHIISYIGTNVDVQFKLIHEYYDEKIYVDVYDSKGKIVASADSYFDESDSDEQIYTFTWLAKNAPAGEYTVLATGSYYTDGKWNLCSDDAQVAVTLKNIPAPKLNSAKNVKGKKISAKWSKVSKATKYQVKIGSKTYTSKKTSFKSKKLKKGKTYSVKVRAYMNKKWSKWSNTKKVKIKK